MNSDYILTLHQIDLLNLDMRRTPGCEEYVDYTAALVAGGTLLGLITERT